MGRRVTTGQTGTPTFEKIKFTSNTITTTTGVTQANTDLVLDPAGTGAVRVSKDLIIYANSDSGSATVGEIRFNNSANTFYVGFKAPALSANRIWTLPTADGTANQMLATNASGTLSWVTPYVSVANETASASTYYPLLSSVTSDTTVTSVNRSSTKLSFVPSTGELTVTTVTTPIITGGTSASGTLTLRSTTNGTKGQVYIDESTASSSITSGALRVAGGVGITGALWVGGLINSASTITCTTLTETSSIAFKENISPLQNALDSILQLSGVMYDRKDGSYKNETGFIAEEVEKVIPNVVTKDQEGNPYGINYTKLVAYLVESVKSLKEEINELKSR